MSKKHLTLVVLLLALALLAAACAAPAPAPAAQPAAEEGAAESAPAESAAAEETVTIGFTASQTGKYNVESDRQVSGLNLWMKQVDEAGGVTLPDGTVLKFEAKSYDDESNTDRVQELYTRLATDDGADFLISPYSSGLTSAASVIAEQYEKVMITTGAASDSNYKQGFTGVYQVYTPASKYLTGAIDFLMANEPELKSVAIVHENSKFATAVAESLNDYAEGNGFDVVLFEGYDSGTTDFAPFINKIQQANPDAILGGGHFQDGSTFTRQLSEKNIDVPYLVLLVAPPEPTFAELGDAAVGVIGPSQWEPQAKFTEEAAKEAGLTWTGPTGEEFTQAYMDAYGEEPSYHAAGGYVAGLVLAEAIKQAGSIDSIAIKQALDDMDLLTFFGELDFESNPDEHGLQVGHSMVYVQWQRDENGNLVKEVIWPAEGSTAEAITR